MAGGWWRQGAGDGAAWRARRREVLAVAGDGELLSPGDAARRLGIAPSTLRIYSVKFAEVLSQGAGRAAVGAGGRPGVRWYGGSDLGLLGQGKELLRRGLTYEQVAAELRPRERARGEAGAAGAGVKRARAVGVAGLGAALERLNVALERATGASEAWERLAEERQREVAALRAQVRELEAALAGLRRRSWWSRLRGGV